MSTTGGPNDDKNKTCRNIAIVFCIIATIGVVIIISLFIWNFAFRYKNKSDLSPVECQSLYDGVAYENFCYVPSSDQLPWQKAENVCVKQSGHLASIPGDQINAGVTNKFTSKYSSATDAWIGLNDMSQVSVYKYSDGSNVTYTNWASSALTLLPADANARRCTSISSGKTQAVDNATSGQWVKHDCTTAYYYICRYALATPPYPPSISSAQPAAGGAQITWTKPTQDGGKKIENYTVTSWPDLINVSTTADILTAAVSGLRPYINYTFTVVATNVVGSSAPSDPSSPVIAGITKPDPPTNVVGKPGPASVVISFTPPKSDGGKPLTSYTVSRLDGSQSQSFPIASGEVKTSVTYNIGLTNGVAVLLQIAAVNGGSGGGPLSSTAVPVGSVTPDALLPGTPTAVVATAYYRNITLTWTAPVGTVTKYTITGYYYASESLINLDSVNVTFPTTTYTFTNLVLRTEYNFFVTAVNTNGQSAPSDRAYATTFPIVPGVPRNVVITPKDRSALVEFMAPNDDGGSDILYFIVQTNGTIPNVTYWTGEDTNYTATYSVSVPNLLTDGTGYTFRVSAFNAIGEGLQSTVSAVTYPLSGSPDAPVNVTAVASGQGAIVSFKAGADNGGLPVQNFTIFAHPGNFSVTVSNTTTTNVDFKTLCNCFLLVDINYTFSVIATNDKGPSAPSNFSNIVVPTPVVPGAPLSVTATPGPQSATVKWNAPANDGGVPITSYDVLSNPGNVTITLNVTANTSLQTVVTHLWDVSKSYTFTVTATNQVGRGASSSASASIQVLATRPDPPANVKVKASFTGAEVSFQAPFNNGGSPVKNYIVVSNPTTKNWTDTDTEVDVQNLDSKLIYTFVVYAQNDQGVSDASLPSEPFQRSTDQVLKDNAVPIAGGIILALLFIVGLIIGLCICKNTEKCCWAREGGSTTSDKKPEPQQTTVDLEDNPKTEPIALGQSSSGYDVTTDGQSSPQPTEARDAQDV